MTLFATEFPVRGDISSHQFASMIIGWIRGIAGSTLFKSDASLDRFEDEATIESSSGERLTLREFPLRKGFVVGARYEIADQEGRLWRSEAILTSSDGKAALRSRSQCIVVKEGVKAHIPKKPYFIKLALNEGWAGEDDFFTVGQEPIFLGEGDIEIAERIISGSMTCFLPVVYISRLDDNKLIIADKKLDKLAYRLGGLAHIVVEPSRAFSIRLKNKVKGSNPYGGAIGVCIGVHGIVRRFIFSEVFSIEEIENSIANYATSYVTSKKPKMSWEWQDIIEESARKLRERLISGTDDIDLLQELYDLSKKEIDEKNQTIQHISDQLESLRNDFLRRSSRHCGIISQDMIDEIGHEIYDGEFSDRLRYICGIITDQDSDIHERTRIVAQKIFGITQYSSSAESLEMRIKGAGKDSGKADARLSEILKEIGFKKRSGDGHPVYVPDKIFGCHNETLSCTPSDTRSGKNAALNIIRNLGLAKLK